jgi:micrococcal nuclease
MRRFRRRITLWSVAACGLAAAVIARAAWNLATADPSGGRPLRAGACRIVKVLGPDELLVQQEQTGDAEGAAIVVAWQVKLLGLKAPGPPWDEAACSFTERFVRRGPATLELDKRRLDDRGRFVAYLFVEGELLNAALLRAGLAQLDPYPGDSTTLARRLRQAHSEARLAGRGMWRGNPQVANGRGP